MDKEIWEIWLEDDNRRNTDFEKYLKLKKIKKEIEVKELVQGHIDKANHNLKFVKSTLELKEFNDWAIVSSYYSIYHASLALCALRVIPQKTIWQLCLFSLRSFIKKNLTRKK
ncbi:hypothetical protein HY212_01380 [Candidatus Pacearchaeota archaeon]|nr:hypothetical protein [Candidatus Pacearchaeota archaeon]